VGDRCCGLAQDGRYLLGPARAGLLDGLGCQLERPGESLDRIVSRAQDPGEPLHFAQEESCGPLRVEGCPPQDVLHVVSTPFESRGPVPLAFLGELFKVPAGSFVGERREEERAFVAKADGVGWASPSGRWVQRPHRATTS